MQRPLQLGKLPSRTLVATSDPSSNLSRLFYVRDTHTQLRFLIDTGSEVSVIPPSPRDRKHPHDKLVLRAANDTPITHMESSRLLLTLDSVDRFHGSLSWRTYKGPSSVLIS